MDAFGELFDHLSIEGGNVGGFAAGHEAVINHHLLINPLGAGIFQIGLDNPFSHQFTQFVFQDGVRDRHPPRPLQLAADVALRCRGFHLAVDYDRPHAE